MEYITIEYADECGSINNSIDDMLSTGVIYYSPCGEETSYSTFLVREVKYHNNIEDGEEYCNSNCYVKEGDITLKGGTLVSDRIYSHEQSLYR